MENYLTGKPGKLPYIDFLRGIAILMVIIVHTNQYSNGYHNVNLSRLTEYCARGVQLFFVLSAFTLYYSYHHRKTEQTHVFRSFFIRRIFRIAPMYYLGIIYYLIQNCIDKKYFLVADKNFSSLNVLSNFTFLNGFNPYWINDLVPGGWSVAVEFTFYAVLPVLFIMITNLNKALNFFLLSVILKSVAEFWLAKHNITGDNRIWTDFLFYYFPSQLPVFATGIITYFVVISKKNTAYETGKLLLILSVVLLYKVFTNYSLVFSDHIIFGVAFACVVVALSLFSHQVSFNPFVQYLGTLSFSMYLIHFAVLHWLVAFNLADFASNSIINFLIRLVIALSLTTFLSFLTYRFIEIPTQKFGKKIILRLSRQQRQPLTKEYS